MPGIAERVRPIVLQSWSLNAGRRGRGSVPANTEDRWRWITFPDGMYQRWDDIGVDERTRLTSLPMDDLIVGRFGSTGGPELLPPGGP